MQARFNPINSGCNPTIFNILNDISIRFGKGGFDASIFTATFPNYDCALDIRTDVLVEMISHLNYDYMSRVSMRAHPLSFPFNFPVSRYFPGIMKNYLFKCTGDLELIFYVLATRNALSNAIKMIKTGKVEKLRVVS